jgi:hypothetical protein
VEALNRDAQCMQILLRHAPHLAEAKRIFESPEGRGLSGVILDVVCMQDEQQEIADPSFLMAAIEYFKTKSSLIPIVVLTGEPDKYKDLKKYFENYLPVYSKGREEPNMLAALKDKVQNLDREKVIRKYVDVFETIEKYIGFDGEDRLISCLTRMSSPENSDITGIVGNLRKLQEYLYAAINRINKEMIPDHLIYRENGTIEIRNEKVLRHLKGNYDPDRKCNTTQEFIKHNSKPDRLFNYLYRGCSEEIHLTDQETTKYTIQSLVFCFMDLTIWLKSINWEAASDRD